jgi:thiol:disulfide interchange protein DsbD
VGRETGGAHRRARGFSLALSYSLGMAVIYTALGVAAGLAGEGLAAHLQTPWVLGSFALVLVLLALSMFGLYEIQLPPAVAGSLNRIADRLPGGRFAGVFAMGGISALIVSPCVAAPLAAALVFLGRTRDVALGGSALFALAAGMSVPLLLVGASAGALLPKAGAWMNKVKYFFGLLLMAVALWTVQPLLPAVLVLALWGILLLAAAAVLYQSGRSGVEGRRAHWGGRFAAGLFAAAGAMQLVGAGSGGTDPLRPLAQLAPDKERAAQPLLFQSVRNEAELDAALAAARQAGRAVMLDFYADWCVSCKEMERFTLSDPAVRERLSHAVLLKADVTQNSAHDRALLKRFGLFGPPGTMFFGVDSREVAAARVIGYQNSERFLQTLRVAGL